VVSVVPRYHLYGCSFAFLLPGILKIPVLQVPFSAVGGIMDQLADGDLLVGFPLFWLHLCALERPFRQKVCGLTSTGPCPSKVFDALNKLGIKCLYEIYGSSETGAAGVRCHYQDNFTLLPHWQRYDEHTVWRATVSGASEKIILPDNVFWADERNFRLLARKDQAVQVGGSNVYPRRIAALIETHPAVKFCRVRLMDANEGSRLKALVVPREIPFAAEALRNELTAWCRGRLAPAQRPRSFTFAGQLPVNHLGKEANWSIAK
jgi:4-coumarate--CoA ligase (photoactive yellow protein activation family)